MASDDVVYGALLLLSIPIGLVFRIINGRKTRELASLMLGIFIIVLTCRKHAVHSILATLVNTIIILLYRRRRLVALYSFIWCFSYLAFFRTCHWFGIAKPSPHSNAVQLILTLRLVGLAAEISDVETLKRKHDQMENEERELRLRYRTIDTSVFSIVSYSFSYIGILTGPFYTCRTYQDMVNYQHSNFLPLKIPLLQTLRPLPICAVVFIILTRCVSAKYMTEDEFYDDTNILYRWFYLALVFTWFRVRMYSAWMLAECMAITAGLGAYPVVGRNRSGGGPTDLKALRDVDGKMNSIDYDFETIRNIKPYEAEFSTTFRSSIKTWNMTVQWWLAIHIYKKIPGSNKFIRGITLMMISSFWHGIHPGYYATFLSAPFLLLAEDSMMKGFRSRLKSVNACEIYDKIASFIRMRFFEYMSIGAFLLQYDQIWRYWNSVYFYGHYSLIGFIVLGELLALTYKKTAKDS